MNNNIEVNKKTWKTEKQTPLDRLDYSGDLKSVIDRIGANYGIGEISDFSLIEVGFEDCNVIIETLKDKYVAKIFSKERSQEDIVRYGAIMEKVLEAGVNHPELMRTGGGNTVYQDDEANGISLVLMKFIEGDNFLALDRTPNAEERQMVIKQAAKINKIDFHPTYLSDTWAIPNIKAMFERVKQFIQPEDIKLIEQAMAQYENIPVDELPYCFVHGDLTKANVMKGDDGKIYVIDFSVAN
jgi:Ser/Thr protein kinase RdoA (MazF antagonist)